jgi:NADPH:quinone reductase-like Zn-dependent oxidoreductase
MSAASGRPPASTRSVRFDAYGTPFHVVENTIPPLRSEQVLVRMAVAAVNGRDRNIRDGIFRGVPAPLGESSNVVGNEGAGVVIAAGASAAGGPTGVGTAVFFRDGYHLPNGGTWQEHVVATAEHVLPIPAGKSAREAAALRVTYQTAVLALELGGFDLDGGAGQSVFVPAIGSGTGNAVVQVARTLGAGRVISTAGSTAKAELAARLGYEHVIDLGREPLTDGVMRLTDGAGVDVAIDILGGPFVAQAVSVLKPGRTLVVCGIAAGPEARISIPDLLRANRGLRPLNMMLTPQRTRDGALDRVLRLWREGRVRPVVARTFPFTEPEAALEHLRVQRPFGKVLLSFE